MPDLRFFHQFTKAIFLHRRKFLRANVVAALKGVLDKRQIDEIVAEMDFADDARTEQLDVPRCCGSPSWSATKSPDWTLS